MKGLEDIEVYSLIPPSEERGRMSNANQQSQEIPLATSRLTHLPYLT